MIILIVIVVLATLAVPSLKALLDGRKVDHAIAEMRVALSQSQRSAIRNADTCGTSILVQTVNTSPDFQADLNSNCPQVSVPELPDGITITSNLIATPMDMVLSSKRHWLASNQILIAEDIGDDDDDDDDQRSAPVNNNTDSNENKVNNSSSKIIEDTSKKTITQESRAKWKMSNCKDWKGCTSSQRAQKGVVDLYFNHQGAIRYDIQTGGQSTMDPSGKFVAALSDQPNQTMKCIAISQRIGLTRIGSYEGGLTPEKITHEGQCVTKAWNKQ